MKSLQERSQQVLPLRYRREPPPQPIPVEALCEYEGEQVPPSPAQGRAEVLPGPSPQGAREWKWHCGREQVFSKPWWLLQWEAKVALAPVGRAGFAAEEQEGSGGSAASLPLTHPRDVATAQLCHVPTLPVLMSRRVPDQRNTAPPPAIPRPHPLIATTTVTAFAGLSSRPKGWDSRAGSHHGSGRGGTGASSST